MSNVSIFKCQEEAYNQLQSLAEYGRHSILIEGPEGSGKTFLAKQFASILEVEDFMVVEPTVSAIRDAIDGCLGLSNNIVICIENLDKGVVAASYTLLKFLEEPQSNVFIVVTCRNMMKIPDTIISRSTCITIGPPIDTDIVQYAESRDKMKYTLLKDSHLWGAVRTFKDVDLVLKMSVDQTTYFESLSNLYSSRDAISNMVWKVGHYEDNTETPVEFVIRYLLQFTKSNYLRRCGIDCIRDISSGRVAAHAAVARFLFEVKYGG